MVITGLAEARKRLEPIKGQFPGLSYADLWILASYVAIEEMGGPKMPFRAGRSREVCVCARTNIRAHQPPLTPLNGGVCSVTVPHNLTRMLAQG